jgi:hypothetical protein
MRASARCSGPTRMWCNAVYHSLAQRGIYYMDFRPSNLNLTGLAPEDE